MTTWWGWAARRARASRLLLATLLALVTITSGILAFVVGHAGSLATEAARTALTTAEPGAGAVQAQTRMGDDVAAQDSSARAKLEEGFAPAPVTIHTTRVSEPRRGSLDGAELPQRITLWAGEHLSPGLLAVTDGAWPTAPTEAALQADAAAALGAQVGSVFTIDDHELTVTALWEAAEKSNPVWFGDPLVTDGADATSNGPLIVDPTALTGGDPFLRWSVVPDADRITPEQLNSLAEAAERAKALVDEADLTGRGIVVDGSLASTAERASRDWAIGRAFGIVPVSVLLLVAAVGLVQVSGLLGATRQREHELLAARGASRRQLLGMGLAEVTLVTVVGTAVGTALAIAALWLVSGSSAQLPTVLLGGFGSLALALMCVWAVTARSTASLAGRPRTDRVRAVAGTAALLIVFAAAAVTTWQLRTATSFELVPALAPAFLLAAAAVVGLVALGPIARLIEAFTRRGSTGIWLAGAQLARGLVVHAVPVTLTILATGTATFAALYAGTAAANHRDLTTLANGAPLRATLSSLDADIAGLRLPGLASVEGVTAAVPVWLDEAAGVGDSPVTAVAAPMDNLADIVALPHGLRLPELPQRAVAVPPMAIPDGASTLAVELTGRTFLDPWQQIQFDRMEEINRSAFQQGDKPLTGEEEAMVRAWTDDFYGRINMPQGFSSRLTLRDLTTGLSRTIPGPAITIDTPPDTFTAPPEGPVFIPLTGRATTQIELPNDGQFVIEGFQIAADQLDGDNSTIELTIAFTADGTPLGGAGQWTSDQAVTLPAAQHYLDAAAAVEPAWDIQVEVVEVEGGGGTVTFRHLSPNKPPYPVAILDTRNPAWCLTLSGAPETISVGPGVPFVGHDPDGVLADVVASRPEPIPVAITTAVADASTLSVGSSLDLAAFGRRLPAVVADVVPALPGIATAQGVMADSAAVSSYLSTTPNPLRWPSEMWASIDADPTTVRAEAARVPGITAVEIADDTPAPTGAAARSLWIAAGSALLLSLTGLAAAAATQLAARRSEVAVLRAMGMTPRTQGRSRAWETGGVLAIATAAGIGAGWLVSWLTVEHIVRSGSDSGLHFRSPLTPDLPPWLAMLAAGALAVAVILWLLAAAVRKQALDNEYREEVR
ncbi:MAG: FtsX-like permease family protein [Propionibacteriaceae bacterium]|nr:FtsX-like permease family protein [Propionibacteriaceae bacterium]